MGGECGGGVGGRGGAGILVSPRFSPRARPSSPPRRSDDRAAVHVVVCLFAHVQCIFYSRYNAKTLATQKMVGLSNV